MARLLNVATPLDRAWVPDVSVTVGLAASVTVPVAVVATLPYWSWAWTTTLGVWTVPAVSFTGAWEKARCVAARALIVKAWLVPTAPSVAEADSV